MLWQSDYLPEHSAKDVRKRAEVAAQALRVRLQVIEARGPEDLDRAFSDITLARVQALIVWGSLTLVVARRRLVEFALKNRLPAMYPFSEFVDAGGLMSYAPNNADNFRRAAGYVDRILKGTRPADLPVEQATKLELVINLKTANAIGLTISPSLLQRADRVIE